MAKKYANKPNRSRGWRPTQMESQPLLFLYREGLGQELGTIQALRADRPARLPTVLIPEEAQQAVLEISGTPHLGGKRRYGMQATSFHQTLGQSFIKAYDYG